MLSHTKEANEVVEVFSQPNLGDTLVESPEEVQKLLPDNQLGMSPSPTPATGDGLGTKHYSPSKVEKPPITLSDAAAQARLRRVCTPNSKGEYKVPEQVIKEFEDRNARMNLMKEFEKLGFDSDSGCLKFQISPQSGLMKSYMWGWSKIQWNSLWKISGPFKSLFRSTSFRA